MKRISTSQTLILVLLILALGCVVAFAANEPTTTIKRVNAQPTATLNGVDLFKEYCAVCHGNGGKGDGPAAEATKKRPADLTQLARKNGGKFPEIHVMNFIKGQDFGPLTDSDRPADYAGPHGTRDMPIWGTVFSSMSTDNPVLVQARVYNLLKFIEELQAK